MKHARIDGSGTGYMRLPHDYKYDDGKPFEVMQAKTMFGASPTVNSKQSLKQIQRHKSKKFIGEDVDAQSQFSEWISSSENPMLGY
jgi:hypothetical protein